MLLMVMMPMEILRNRERNLWKRPIKRIHLAVVLNGFMMVAVPSEKTRKSQETRLVHVVQKRNTGPVAGRGQGKSLQFPMIKLLNPEKVERKRSEAREGLTHRIFYWI